MHAFIYTNICGNERKANIIFININYSACLARNGNISVFCPDNIILRLENQLVKSPSLSYVPLFTHTIFLSVVISPGTPSHSFAETKLSSDES